MSITVRAWSKEDLFAIGNGDKWLATIFMNCSTFSEEDTKHYPYKARRTYFCQWLGDEECLEDNNVTIHATDQRMLLKFIDAEYTKRPDSILQVITQYRPIKVS